MNGIHSSILPTLLITCLVQSGCHGPLNQQNGLLDADPPLPALQPTPSAALLARQPQGAIVPLDRSAWPMEVVVVDQGQVEAEPSYGSAEPVVGQLDQASMDWPTTHSALSTQLNDGDEALNGLLCPIVAAGNIVIFPVRAFVTPPWKVIVVTPQPTGFQLLPHYQSATPWHWVDSNEEDGVPQ